MLIFFLALYLPVIGEEESHLRKILPGYIEYERKVPRVVPSLRSRYHSDTPFSAALYRKNQEYQASVGFAVGMLSLFWKALA